MSTLSLGPELTSHATKAVLDNCKIIYKYMPGEDHLVAETAKLLAIRPGAPLLLMHRLTFLEDGTPFDLEAVRYRGDRCALTTTIPRPPPDSSP